MSHIVELVQIKTTLSNVVILGEQKNPSKETRKRVKLLNKRVCLSGSQVKTLYFLIPESSFLFSLSNHIIFGIFIPLAQSASITMIDSALVAALYFDIVLCLPPIGYLAP